MGWSTRTRCASTHTSGCSLTSTAPASGCKSVPGPYPTLSPWCLLVPSYRGAFRLSCFSANPCRLVAFSSTRCPRRANGQSKMPISFLFLSFSKNTSKSHVVPTDGWSLLSALSSPPASCRPPLLPSFFLLARTPSAPPCRLLKRCSCFLRTRPCWSTLSPASPSSSGTRYATGTPLETGKGSVLTTLVRPVSACQGGCAGLLCPWCPCAVRVGTLLRSHSHPGMSRNRFSQACYLVSLLYVKGCPVSWVPYCHPEAR